ncbi:hypothetical protein SAMN06296036_108242 [Pseudobacteriovorax antillogorgiicola]|uniref:Extracellular solute-binding protein, family 3 n=1 Tax=Pseudobacteriovorax antillogorgiicola TaxID=1513793 RepID=A0A1Y6BYM5_9BACT|nr:hypothetical protein EDD56_1085 [Pseudobacteriovorax antillogorgiicola]SMF27632.1 hypothetical protein SAMN06296036_108242 [Pseudobacteriovorax antillogorgiicola]
MRNLIQAISFIVSLTLLASSSYSKEYVIGVESLEYRPHYFTSSNGSFLGFSREVLDHFAEKMNVKLTFMSFL